MSAISANDQRASFELAARQMMDANHDVAAQKYPDLFHWKAMVDAERAKQ